MVRHQNVAARIVRKKAIYICITAIVAAVFVAYFVVTRMYDEKLVNIADQVFSYPLPEQSEKCLEKASRYNDGDNLVYRTNIVIKSSLEIEKIKEHYDKAIFKDHNGEIIKPLMHQITDLMELYLLYDDTSTITHIYEDDNRPNGFYYTVALYDYDEVSIFDIRSH